MVPPAIRLPPTTFTAIILIQILALTVRAYVQLQLQQSGLSKNLAKDLSYPVVPFILLTMLLPVVRQRGALLRSLFDTHRLTLRLILISLTIGVLLRLLWWSQLITRVAFGITQNDDPLAVIGPYFNVACPPIAPLVPSIAVIAIATPLFEETLHRGLIQSALVHRGRWIAITLSAAIFALLHPPADYAFAFAAGIVFGVMFWNSGTLYPTVIAHAGYNFMAILDSRCLRGQWNPQADDLPSLTAGIPAISILILSSSALLWLIKSK